jgi:hypothetical protein
MLLVAEICMPSPLVDRRLNRQAYLGRPVGLGLFFRFYGRKSGQWFGGLES